MAARRTLCRAAETDRGPWVAALLVLMFGTMVLVTRLFCADSSGYTSFWPANAAMVGALLMLRLRYAIPALTGCFCLNFGLNSLGFLSPDESLLACTVNVVQAIVVALLTRRYCGALTDLTRFRRFATFTLITLAVTATDSAVGVAIEKLFLHDDSSVVREWAQWVLCDLFGLLVATPVVILVIRHIGKSWRITRTMVEPVILLVLTVLLTFVSFLLSHSPLFLMIFPAMVTLAFRARPIWVLTSVLVISIFVSAMTAHNLGPIALLSPDGRLMRESMLQPYLLSLLLSALPASNALGEKLRVSRRLAQMTNNLEHAATHDPLTTLMNRQLFKKRLTGCVRSGKNGAVLFIDLDHFKRVNDMYGHQTGDEVLWIFGKRIGECARRLGGEAARFGGDEFAMLIPEQNPGQDIDGLCASVLRTARIPYQIGHMTVLMSVSIGAASVDVGHGDTDKLLRNVDLAMYSAKKTGRDRYRIFDDELKWAIAYANENEPRPDQRAGL
ncbi:MAG: diguanylate cyclase domain-containing protein [Janthinobacterium lividum]